MRGRGYHGGLGSLMEIVPGVLFIHGQLLYIPSHRTKKPNQTKPVSTTTKTQPHVIVCGWCMVCVSCIQICIYHSLCMCIYVGSHVPQCGCGTQRITCRSWLSPTIWGLRGCHTQVTRLCCKPPHLLAQMPYLNQLFLRDGAMRTFSCCFPTIL